MTRTTGRRRLVPYATVSVAALWATGLFGLLSASPANAAQPCVGVIVDARLLGGGVSTGCAEGDPGSGLAALEDAGFRYGFTPRQPGFVCSIDSAPECGRTGTTTYWSYWHRAEGSRTWVYSSAGAGSHDPAPGSTDAWVWQDGGRRRPPDVALGTICPQVTAARTERAAPSASAPRARSSRSAAATTPTPTTPSPTAPPPGTTGQSGQPPSSSSSEPTTPAPAGSAPADDGPDRTPWTGVAIGGGLVAALGAAALARSRRPSGSP